MNTFWITMLAPIAWYLVFGLLYVFLPPPLDAKALRVLKLRPVMSAQIADLIRHKWPKPPAPPRGTRDGDDQSLS